MTTIAQMKAELAKTIAAAKDAEKLLLSLGYTVTKPGKAKAKPRKGAAVKVVTKRHRPSDFKSPEFPYGRNKDGSAAKRRGPAPKPKNLKLEDVIGDAPATEAGVSEGASA